VFLSRHSVKRKAVDLLKTLSDRIAYSVITYLELLTGANTSEKKAVIKQIFESYYGIPINETISLKAIEIMYNNISGQRNIAIPDCLIAATATVTGFSLLTFNLKDFDFVGEVKLYRF
jgi:predicted nucleic acid-binding protein